MRTYDVQGIQIGVRLERAFDYIADPKRLPEWTSAFASVSNSRAVMRTPAGSMDIDLRVDASPAHGTVDWTMRFPDRSEARAYSRLVPVGRDSIYSFVLLAPPVPLEQLEGALEQQSRTLAAELARLRGILEQKR